MLPVAVITQLQTVNSENYH